MTNEIKEILEYLKDDSIFIYDEDGTRKEITLDESKLLLDYITNLQEDLANYVNVVLYNRKVIDDLQQRIDKAIKYIENDIDLTGINGFEKLLDILRGDE